MITSNKIGLYPIHKFCKHSVFETIGSIAEDSHAPANASSDCSLAVFFYHAYIDIYAVDFSTINHEAELLKFTSFLSKFTDVTETQVKQYVTLLRDILPFIQPADSRSGEAITAGTTVHERLNYYLGSEYRAKEWTPSIIAFKHIQRAYGSAMAKGYVEAIRELRITEPYLNPGRITRTAIKVSKLLSVHFPSADLLFGSDNHAWESFVAATHGLAQEHKTDRHSMPSPRFLHEAKTVLNVFMEHGLIPAHAALINALDRDLSMSIASFARRLELMTLHYARPTLIQYLPPDIRKALSSL
jgi:hypothetical protein